MLVGEGFSWGALCFGPFWFAVHRAWIPAVLVLVATVLIIFLTTDGVSVALMSALALLLGLFQFTSLGLRMRAAAFGQEVARLLGVRVSQLLTFGWALAGLFGSLAGLLIAGGSLVSPGYMDGVVVFGFVAAVLGGLDSFVGAVVGGAVLGLVTTYVAGYGYASLVTLAALAILLAVLLLKPGGLFSSSVARRV